MTLQILVQVIALIVLIYSFITLVKLNQRASELRKMQNEELKSLRSK